MSKYAVQAIHEMMGDGIDLRTAIENFESQVVAGNIAVAPTYIPPGARMRVVVPPDGGLVGVPHPECLESHLPLGREPTLDELIAAWAACIGK